jgi:hypothetical protein
MPANVVVPEVGESIVDARREGTQDGPGCWVVTPVTHDLAAEIAERMTRILGALWGRSFVTGLRSMQEPYAR